MCEYMRQDTLFIGNGALVGKMGNGRMVIREGRPRGVDHGQNRPLARSSRRYVNLPIPKCLVLKK